MSVRQLQAAAKPLSTVAFMIGDLRHRPSDAWGLLLDADPAVKVSNVGATAHQATDHCELPIPWIAGTARATQSKPRRAGGRGGARRILGVLARASHRIRSSPNDGKMTDLVRARRPEMGPRIRFDAGAPPLLANQTARSKGPV